MKNKRKLFTGVIAIVASIIGITALCLIMIVSFVGRGQSEVVKEIKYLEEKIATLEKQREINLSHLREEESLEYHKWEVGYAHEIAYLNLRRRAFQALQGDANARPIAREYFATYIPIFEAAINAKNDGHDLEWSLKWLRDTKREYEGYLEKLENK